MFNALVGKTVKASVEAAQKTKAFLATPKGELAKVAMMGAYLGYVAGALVQHALEEV